MTPERWPQTEALLHAALAHPPGERGAFLMEACAGDEALRQELESLLKAHQEAAGFMESPALEVAAKVGLLPLDLTDEAPVGEKMIGQQISHYTILEELGQGGMGTVYLARDIRLNRLVALKVLSGVSLSDPEANQRLLREARAVAALEHPNICAIHELAQADGCNFIVMQYVKGETLARMLKRDKMRLKEVLNYAVQVVDAIQEAHTHGIIHRDIKPANIIINVNGQVKVLDFGLAKFTEHREAKSKMTTAGLSNKSGAIMGTVAFMSPEQVRGKRVDARTDIFSFGAMLYEMSCGRQAFARDTDAETISAILRDQPSWKEIPSELQPILEKCLMKNADERYQTAKELAADLRALGAVEDRPKRGGSEIADASRSANLPYHLTRFIGRRRGRIAAALVLLGLGVFFTVSRISRAPARNSMIEIPAAPPVKARRSVAVLGFKNLSQRSDVAWLSTAFSEMLSTELAAGEKLRTIPGEQVVRMKVDLALADADSFTKDTLARVRTNLGTDLVVLGSYVALGENGQEQIRLDLRVQDAAAGETIASLSDTGTQAELLSLVARTGATLRDKLGVGELSATEAAGIRASLPPDPELARLYTEGLAKLRLSENLAARDLFLKAVAADPQYPLAHSGLAAAWLALGYDARAADAARRAFEISGMLSREERLSIEGRYREMADDRQKAIEIYQTLFNFFPDNLDYGLRLAGAQTAAGKGKDALATLEMLRKLPSPSGDDPGIDIAKAEAAESLGDSRGEQVAASTAGRKAAQQGARILLARARLLEAEALTRLGELSKAVAASKEAQRIYAAAGDRNGEGVALTHIAVVLGQQGNHSEQKRLYQKVLDLSRETGNRRRMATVTNNIANVLLREGRLSEALKMFDEALAGFREIGARRPMAFSLNNGAIALKQQGNLDGAKARYAESLAISREIGQKDMVANTLNNLAIIVSDRGNLSEARNMYEEALAIAREIGQKSMIARTLGNLANVLSRQGDVLAAKSRCEEAVRISRKVGEKREIAYAVKDLADALYKHGELTEAKKQFEAALTIAREIGERVLLADIHSGLGDVFLAEGDIVGAKIQQSEALAIRQAAVKADVPRSYLGLARDAIEAGRPAEGEGLARQAVEIYRVQKEADSVATAYAVLARSLLAQTRASDAQNALDRAVEFSRTSQDQFVRVTVATMDARLRAGSRNPARISDALENLKKTLAETTRMELFELQLETSLTLGELEMAGGYASAGRTRLAVLVKNAAEKGFGLISRKAAAAVR